MVLREGKNVGAYSNIRGIEEYSRCNSLDFASFIRARIKEMKVITDLGCGKGNFCSDVKLIFPEIKVLGVDRESYSDGLKGDDFLKADISGDLRQIPCGSVDLVVSTAVSQWLSREELERFYVNIDRILKPEGLAVVFPVGSSLVRDHSELIRDLGFSRPYKIRAYSLQGVPVTPQMIFGNSLEIEEFYRSDEWKYIEQ